MTPTPDTGAMREAAEKATPGPWEPMLGMKWRWVDAPHSGTWVCDMKAPRDAKTEGEAQEEDNARYIALANPTNVLALLDALEEAKKALERLSIAVASCAEAGFDQPIHSISVLAWKELDAAQKAARSALARIHTLSGENDPKSHSGKEE